jgi:hypothetical protein
MCQRNVHELESPVSECGREHEPHHGLRAEGRHELRRDLQKPECDVSVLSLTSDVVLADSGQEPVCRATDASCRWIAVW